MLGRLAEVNPPVPEFEAAASDAQVTFMPLEACWADGNADFSRRVPKSVVSNGYTRFRDGDVLLPKITPTFEAARVFPTTIDTGIGAATTEVHVLRTRPHADARFVAYIARSQPFLQLGAASLQGVGNLRRVTADFVRTFPVAALDRVRQASIADYLDRETAQIDTLIAKQEQLIATLRERRVQMIARGVTGGLNDADHVDSGVPWLGPIKQSWSMLRVRHVVDIGTGYGDTVDAEPNGPYPFYVRSQVPLRSDDFDHEGPAVLTAGDGAGVAKVFHLVDGKFKAHQRVYVLGNFRHVTPKFFLAYFSTFFSRVALDGSAKSTVDSVRRPMIADMPICVPTWDEQREITAHLDERTAQIDTLIAKAERFIELSKERRAALITAAVTGQIEVPAA